MPIFSVNASEHSVSTTKIFTVGEQQMIADWLQIFPKGILSVVADTFSTWEFIKYCGELKDEILARDGKLVCRPDSGNPVDIICGTYQPHHGDYNTRDLPEHKGVIELLWDIFGGTINEQGYKVLDHHIGAIYGDSITPERQRQIYERLAAKGFAATNIVLGVGSFTYQYNTRDTLGFAAKGAWFEVKEHCVCEEKQGKHFAENAGEMCCKKSHNIYKDPVTDDGTKKSLKGLLKVHYDSSIETYQALGCPADGALKPIVVKTECTAEEENQGILQVIYEDGKFYNQTTLTEIRERVTLLS